MKTKHICVTRNWVFLILIAAGILLLPDAALAARYFSFGNVADSQVGGNPWSDTQVAVNETFNVRVWASWDEPGNSWAATQYWFSWDPTQLQWVDSAIVAPNVAVYNPTGLLDANTIIRYDTPNGVYAGNVIYGSGAGKMTAGMFFSITMKKLTAGAATLTVQHDTLADQNQTGTSIYRSGANGESIALNTYDLIIYSSETDSPIIEPYTISQAIVGETLTISNLTVYDSSASLDNMSCSIYLADSVAPLNWKAIELTCDTYHDTIATFSGSLPPDTITGYYMYYYFVASDTYGNLGKSDPAVNMTDTSGADSFPVYSNVPLTIMGFNNEDDATDSDPFAVRYECGADSLYLWVYTMADAISVMEFNVATSSWDTVSYVHTQNANLTVVACSVPVSQNGDSHQFFIVGNDTDIGMPRTVTDTFYVIADTTAPIYGTALINNGATSLTNGNPYSANFSCSIALTAADTNTISGYYVSNGDVFNVVTATKYPLVGAADTITHTFTSSDVSETYIATFSAVAYDSGGNYDSATVARDNIIVDTRLPQVYTYSPENGGVIPTWQAPPDSQRVASPVDVTIAVSDSSTIDSVAITVRHPNLTGQDSWTVIPMTSWGTVDAVYTVYGCSIPAAVTGYGGLNDALYGVEFYGQVTDAWGFTNYVDSMGVVDSYGYTAAQAQANPDSMTFADSVMITMRLCPFGDFQDGDPSSAIDWYDTEWVDGDGVIYVNYTTYAETVALWVIDGYGVGNWSETGIVLSQPQLKNDVWTDTLSFNATPGVSYVSLWAMSDTDPSREGQYTDTFWVICDTVAPTIYSVTLENGSTAIDSGLFPAISVVIAAGDTPYLGASDTSLPNTMLVADSYYYNAQIDDSGISYAASTTCTWTQLDTDQYRVWVWVQDRAGNDQEFSATIYHDTMGPQVINFAGIPDDRSGSQALAVTFDLYDQSGTVAIDEVKIFYRHDDGYPAMAWWDDTDASFKTGANTWEGYIPDTAVGGVYDTTVGVKYYIRTRDALGHYTYWGHSDTGAYTLGNWHDTLGAVDAVAQAEPAYDTFTVVLAVPTTITVTQVVADVGSSTVAITNGMYTANDTIAIKVVTEYSDSISIGNYTTGETRPFGVPTYDTVTEFALAAGANLFVFDIRDTDMPNYWNTYTIYADTDAPLLYADSMQLGSAFTVVGGRDTVVINTSTFDGVFTPVDTMGATVNAVYQMRVGEDAGFTIGDSTAWEAYRSTVTYAYTTQDTIPIFFQVRDRAGNLSAVITATINVDTEGPAITHTAVADSRAAGDTLNLTVTLDDECGTYGMTAVVWSYSQAVGTWVPDTMTQAGITNTWNGTVPIWVIGATDTTISYVIEAWDTWGQKSYYLNGGSRKDTTLAGAQANPDTFTTITSVMTHTFIYDGNDVAPDSKALISNGMWVNADSIFLNFLTDADSVLVLYNGDSWAGYSVAASVDSTSWQDTIEIGLGLIPGTNSIRIIGADASMPDYGETFTIVCDTAAPDSNSAVVVLYDSNSVFATATDDTTVALAIYAADSTGAVTMYRMGETPGFYATAPWINYTAGETLYYTFTNTDTNTFNVHVQFADSVGNVSDTVTGFILHDTEAPRFIYDGVSDSRAAGQSVSVRPEITDLSTVTGLNAFLFFKHDPDTPTWLGVEMVPDGGNFYVANIPDTVVGGADDTVPLTAYYIKVSDSFGNWRYFGYGADSSFANEAAVQAAPDSFTTVWALPTTSEIIDEFGTDTQTMADSIYVNSTACSISVRSPQADTLWIGHYIVDKNTVIDTYSSSGSDTYLTLYLVDNVNFFVIIAADSVDQAGSLPMSFQTYAIYCDTYAPYSDTLSLPDTAVQVDTMAYATNDTTVTIYLDLTDTDLGIHVDGGIQYYAIAESDTVDLSVTDSFTLTSNCSYAVSNADGDSLFTLYMWFWDYAGNQSSTITRTIYYDTAGPYINFTAIADSRATNAQVPISATVWDMSGTPASVAVVTYHASTQVGWETWALTSTGGGAYSGVIPDTVVGSSPELSPGVPYYLAAQDSWNNWSFWANDIQLGANACTDVAIAVTLPDTFTVANPVSVSAAAQDIDNGTTYVSLNKANAGPAMQYYRSDSFSVRFTTAADSISLWVRGPADAVWLQVGDTFALDTDAIGQVVVFDSCTMIADTMYLRVWAYDLIEPINEDTWVIIADTTAPSNYAGPWIDYDTLYTADTTVSITWHAMDSYPVSTIASIWVGETHPRELTDTAAALQTYDSPIYYTFADTSFTTVTLFVLIADSAGNSVIGTDQITFDTNPPAVTFAGVADSQSSNQQVSVSAAILDQTGTEPVTAFLWYKHDPDTAVWASSQMTPQIDGTFQAGIPASVVGVDTKPWEPVQYFIQTYDIFGHYTYWSYGGDSFYTTLAEAQTYPDTFTLVDPIATSVQLQDANDTGWQYIAYSGQVFDTPAITLRILSGSDSLAIIVGDSYTSYDSITAGAWSTNLSKDLPIYNIVDETNTIRIIATDSTYAQPAYDNTWQIVVDTTAPTSGSATVGDSTVLSSVSANMTFTAQDSHSVVQVVYYGDITSGTAAYTGAAMAVTLTAGEGWKNVFQKYYDEAGNLSIEYGDSFYVDLTAGTITVGSITATTTATYTCTGTVVDNYVDTPTFVTLSMASDTGTTLADSTVFVADAWPAATFQTSLQLLAGLNTITVSFSDTAGHVASDAIVVALADAVVAATDTTTVTTISDTLGGSIAITNSDSSSPTIVTIVNTTGTETAAFAIEWALDGYSATIERFSDTDLATLQTTMIPGEVTTDNWAYSDSLVFRITAVDSNGAAVGEATTPYDSITLTWTYNVPADVESNLHVYYAPDINTAFQKATDVGGLVPAGGAEVQDLVAKTIALPVTHLSVWGIFAGGAPLMANLDNVVIFPNPFKPYDGNTQTGTAYDGNVNGASGIHFMNLASGTEIEIYTINGELVDEVALVPNQGLAVWDARNKGGGEVASGVYLVVFKANGQVVVKKLAIIR